MSEGDGMAERLDELAGEHQHWCQADAHGDCCNGECDCGQVERRAAIAAALADERKKARLPFRILAAQLDSEVENAEVWDGTEMTAFQEIADRIRRVAEETL